MLRLYITRHGETEWNRQKRMQGWKDSELTDVGIANAISLGERLAGVEFNRFYVSSSMRTQQTAQYILGDRSIPIILDEELREIHMGSWEGETQVNLQQAYPEQFHDFWNNPHLFVPVGGETFYNFYARTLKALNRITRENEKGNVLIVTHTVVIKALLAHFKNDSLEHLWNPPYIHDTSLSIIEFNGNDPKILMEGDIAHTKIHQNKH